MKHISHIAAVCFLLVLPVSCDRHRFVTKPMTWECAEDEYNASFYARPDEYARFRFVENPHCFDVQSSKNFCAELRKSGNAVVNVEFEVWNHGYRMVAVNGRPMQDVGGGDITARTITRAIVLLFIEDNRRVPQDSVRSRRLAVSGARCSCNMRGIKECQVDSRVYKKRDQGGISRLQKTCPIVAVFLMRQLSPLIKRQAKQQAREEAERLERSRRSA